MVSRAPGTKGYIAQPAKSITKNVKKCQTIELSDVSFGRGKKGSQKGTTARRGTQRTASNHKVGDLVPSTKRVGLSRMTASIRSATEDERGRWITRASSISEGGSRAAWRLYRNSQIGNSKAALTLSGIARVVIS